MDGAAVGVIGEVGPLAPAPCVLALEWDEGKDEDVGEDVGVWWIGPNATIAGT